MPSDTPQSARSPAPAFKPEWSRIAASADFRHLTAAKARFIVPTTIVFILYYFALPVLVGYFPHLMERRVFGAINLAYLFAISQFFMAWVIMALYVRQARRWDQMEHALLEELNHRDHGGPRAGMDTAHEHR